MNGDYIDLAGPASEADIVERLVELLEPAGVIRTEMSFPLLTLDEHNFLFVDVDPDRAWPTMLAIGNVDNDDQTRQTTAKNVFHALECTTSMPMRWTSDVSPDVVTHTD